MVQHSLQQAILNESSDEFGRGNEGVLAFLERPNFLVVGPGWPGRLDMSLFRAILAGMDSAAFAGERVVLRVGCLCRVL